MCWFSNGLEPVSTRPFTDEAGSEVLLSVASLRVGHNQNGVVFFR